MRQLVFFEPCFLAIALSTAVGCSSADPTPSVEGTGPQGHPGTGTVVPNARIVRYVVLEGPGAIASIGVHEAEAPTGRARIVARAAELRAQHDAIRPALAAYGATVVADVVLVANVLQVAASPDAFERIAALPAVARIETPTVLSASRGEAVPLVGVPEVWTSSNLHGEGMRVGVIDSGIDYFHADFGGSGDPGAYAADDPTVIEAGSFPTAVVAGGLDLAGDGYDASGLDGDLIPTPDDDPLDCRGHGTHVAGIAAGRGVVLAGSTYQGSYDASLDPAAFTVAPGVAPLASL